MEISDNIYPPFNYVFGRPLKYTPDELIEKFAEYVQWCKDNPIKLELKEQGLRGNGAVDTTKTEYKPRFLNLRGFLSFIGGSDVYWHELEEGKHKEHFSKVKKAISTYIQSYQIEYAAAGVFKENIVSRLNGLTDKQEHKHEGDGIKIVVQSEEEKSKIEGIGDLGI